MIRKTYEGDLFDSRCQTLVCPVNTLGTMGKGLALTFKRRVRGLEVAYKEACRLKLLTTERVWLYRPMSGPQVLCVATKQEWWKPSKKEYIEASLMNLVERLDELQIESLAIPPVGCGLGQLDYVKCVKPLLMQYLDPLEIPVDIVFL